jgi:hypothetical protein
MDLTNPVFPLAVVMQSVKDDISRERNGIQSSDVTLFFEVAKFFTAYQRYKFSILKVFIDYGCLLKVYVNIETLRFSVRLVLENSYS